MKIFEAVISIINCITWIVIGYYYCKFMWSKPKVITGLMSHDFQIVGKQYGKFTITICEEIRPGVYQLTVQ